MALRMQSSGNSAQPISLRVEQPRALVEVTPERITNDAASTVAESKPDFAGYSAGFGPELRRGRHPYVGKRAFDLTIAIPIFLVLLPLLVCVWGAVRLTSRGPAIYWSERVGRDGKLFRMPKFRTMSVDAPIVPREKLKSADVHDTPVGQFLRRSSIDELPQLWSVLQGHMSLIGPRPLLPIDPGVAERRLFPESLAVPPGLSGLAQVRGRNLVTPRRKARLDALYAKRASFIVDSKLILATFGIVFKRSGIT